MPEEGAPPRQRGRAEDTCLLPKPDAPAAQARLLAYDPQLARAVRLRCSEEEAPPRDALGLLAACVLHRPRAVIMAYLASAGVALLGAVRLMDVTNLDLHSAPGMQAYEAGERFEAVFPGIARGADFVGILEVQAPAQVLAVPGLPRFAAELLHRLNSSGQLLSFTGGPQLGAGRLAGAMLSGNNGSATLFQWAIAEVATTNAARAFAKEASDTFNALARQLPGIHFSGVAGLALNVDAEVRQADHDLMHMDIFAIPFALAVQWYVIQSWRLLLVPLICMGTAAALSFGMMFCVGHVQLVMATTPSLMMSILVAMSVDYSLFILTRFKEELRLKALPSADSDEGGPTIAQIEDAVVRAMRSAGFLVLLSGLLLLASFVMLLLVPSDIIKSLAVGGAVALFLTIGTHLTLVPALLGTFPRFFARGALAVTAKTAGGGEGQGHARAWGALARVTTTYPANACVVAAVVAFTLAVGSSVLRIRTSTALQTNIPRGTEVAGTFKHLASAFGAGSTCPYMLMLEAPAGGSVLTREFWQASQQILEAMASDVRDFDGTVFELPVHVAGAPVPWAAVEACLGAARQLPYCGPLLQLVDSFTNPGKTAIWGYVISAADPLGTRGREYLRRLREAAQAWSQRTGIRVTLAGVPADLLDLVGAVYSAQPQMVATTLAMVLLLLGLACRSVVVPLRSVASICLTLLWVYGIAVRTFQDGALDWLGAPSLSGEFAAVPWMPPVVCFTLVVGICLDYDLFLLSRATELRAAGLGPTEAVQQALCRTGGVITAAGLIMAIAFGGLLFSASVNVSAIAFFLVFAVLYDTFVVRCLFTPALMSLLGRFNWWPGSLAKAELQPAKGEAFA